MSLYDDIQILEEKLSGILDELQELRFRAAALEEQNSHLRERVSLENLEHEGHDALASLYNDGFHICPSHFAQAREGDCMFCMSFLQQQQLAQKEG